MNGEEKFDYQFRHIFFSSSISNPDEIFTFDLREWLEEIIMKQWLILDKIYVSQRTKVREPLGS